MSEELYFSEREGRQRARAQEKIGPTFWNGFVATVRVRLADGSFAEDFPMPCCFEHHYPKQSDDGAIGLLFRSEVGGASWPLDLLDVPDSLTILDAVEFFGRYISHPAETVNSSSQSNRLTPQRSMQRRGNRAEDSRHFHILSFDRAAGLAAYVCDVNRLFRRCGHPFEIQPNGLVQRMGPPVLHETLSTTSFQTGDSDLDRLLVTAREKFFDADPAIRAEGVEKLWDAWERLKTLCPGDKKTSVAKVLDQAVPEPNLRSKMEQEAIALTKIGNDFMIRHTETNKIPIQKSEHLDYLFHRLFALIWMILKSRGAVGT